MACAGTVDPGYRFIGDDHQQTTDSMPATLSLLFRNLIPVLVLLLLLASCGMFTGTPAASRPGAHELETVLTSELTRMGKSPSDSTPHAPAGSTNAVFDLACAVVDPDGEPDGEGGGELPPTGIALGWTERLLGDYNLDGQINAGDLAPLGINWLQAVQYDAATLHGGIAYWPMGSAVDDGGSPYPAPPAAGSGARNWRLARIDAQSDGVLDVKDVTPIAVHWCEQSSGYRVYVKLPGGTEFLLVPEDGSTPHQPSAGEVTLPRTAAFPTGQSSADPTRPVRFGCTYEDGGHGGPPHGLPEGRYEYYVTAYDAATDSEGPASAHVVLDITGGVANQPPVAVLTVSPDFAGAPAVITFDASQSSDPDGSIKEYRWDFDADGVVDWSTADETVPEQSSGGEVDTITPGEAPGAGLPPASVTVTYHQGHAQYLYPRVTVVDDQNASGMQSVKLGVSGWMRECLNTSETDYKLLFYPNAMSIDPTTHEVVVAGRCTDYGVNYMMPTGTYWARRHADGTWETQLMPVPNDGVMIDGLATTVTAKDIEWDENGKPIVLLDHYVSGFGGGVRSAVWTAQLNASDQWQCVERYFASLPEAQAYGSYCGDLVPYSPGSLAGTISEKLYDKSSLHGTDWHNRYHMLVFNHGTWSIEYTGYDSAERQEYVYPPVSPEPGQVYSMFINYPPLINGVWWTQWRPGFGLGEPEQIPGTAGFPLYECIIFGTVATTNGALYILYDGTNNRKLVRIKPGGAADYYDFIADKPQYATTVPYPHGLHAISNGAAVFVAYGADYGTPKGKGTPGEHWRWEGENWIREETLPFQPLREAHYCCSAVNTTSGQEYLMVSRYYVAEQDWPRQFTGELLYFCTRLDPRIGP